MTRLMHWLAPLVLLALAPAPGAAQSTTARAQLEAGDSWNLLATQVIYPATRTARIDLTKTRGRSKGIRIGSRQGGLVIERVAIGYSNGQVHYEEPDKPVVLRSESDRLEMDVRMEERFVDTIDISYRFEGRSNAAVQLIVEAAQSAAGRHLARGPHAPSPTVVAVAKDVPMDAAARRMDNAKRAAEEAKAAEARKQEEAAKYARRSTEQAPVGGADRSATPRTRGLTTSPPPTARREESDRSLGSQPPAPMARSDEMERSRSRSVTTTPQAEPKADRSRSAAAAAPASDKPYTTVDIYFGTDRKEEAKRQKFDRTLASFGPQANRALTLGKAVVTVPRDRPRQSAEIPRPEWDLIVTRFALRNEDMAKDFTIFSVDVLDKRKFLTEVQKTRERSQRFRNQAIVFVHGFNVSFDDALFRAAQISYDLEFDGVPFMFSWPSRAGLSGYILDRDRARNAQSYLKQFIELIERETGAQKIHLIAHSMGADPLLGALREMAMVAPPGARPGRMRFGEIILAAPDVTVDNYEQAVSAIANLATGMTLYASSNDWALRISQQLRLGEPIAGLTPPIITNGIDSIDVSAANTDFFSLNHSTFADRAALLNDMHNLMETGMRPPSKRFDLFRPIVTKAGPYWKYEPATSATNDKK